MYLPNFLAMSSSKAHGSRNHFLFIFFFIFLSRDFHELWRSVMNIGLFTEVKQLILGWVTASVY